MRKLNSFYKSAGEISLELVAFGKKTQKLNTLILTIVCTLFFSGCPEPLTNYTDRIELTTCTDLNVTIPLTHPPSCAPIDNPCADSWGQGGTDTYTSSIQPEQFTVDHEDFYIETSGTGSSLARGLCYTGNQPLSGVTFGYDYSYDETLSAGELIQNYGSGNIIVDTSGNAPPIASFTAGPFVQVLNNPVALDASASNDPEGLPLTYSWSLFEAPVGSLEVINNPTAQTTSISLDQVGRYSIQLVVNDGTDDSLVVKRNVYGVLGFSDLAITKTSSPNPAIMRTDRLTYTLEVTNNGPDDALDVVVIDNFQNYRGLGMLLDIDNITVSNGGVCLSSAPETIQCSLGGINFGEPPVTITIESLIESPNFHYIRSLGNTARVTTQAVIDGNAETDPYLDNNESLTNTRIIPLNGYDLHVAIDANPQPIKIFDLIIYNITVDNNGLDDALDVVLFNSLPEVDPILGGSRVIVEDITTSQGTCSGPPRISGINVMECALGDLLYGDPPAIVTVVTRPIDDPSPGTEVLRNVASVTTESILAGSLFEDTNTFNNRAELYTILLPTSGIDLAIEKADTPDPVIVNNFLTYELTVVNNGPDDAADVLVLDDLPGNMNIQSMSTTQGTCTAPLFPIDPIECHLGDMIAGAPSVLITIVVTPTMATAPNLDPIVNIATVTTLVAHTGGSDPEVYPENNTSEVTTVVLPSAASNTPPIADTDSFNVNEDEILMVDVAPGILGNDFDGDSDQLTAILTEDVFNGVLNLNPDGTFDYTPNLNYFGGDSFKYVANDGNANSNEVTVIITVLPVNDIPTADAINKTAPPYLLGNLIELDGAGSNDLESPTVTYLWEVTLAPAGSVAALSGTTIVNPTFTPDVVGDYTIILTVNDGTDDSLPSGVSFSAVASISAPVANIDSYNADEDVTLNVSAPGVLDNDTDTENDPLTAVLDTDVSNGTLTLNANGSFSYTSDLNYNGPDSFSYHANDGSQDSNIVTVDITVDPVNDIPVADAQVISSPPYSTGTPIQLDGSGSTDLESDPLTFTYQWSVFSAPPGSTATFSDATIVNPTFTPDVSGNYVFELVVNDGDDDSDPATANVGVELCGPSTKNWVGNADGVWSNPANWDGGTLPIATDDVCIDVVASDITVTYDGGTDTVNSLLSNEEFIADTGTLTINGTSQLLGDVTINSSIINGAGDIFIFGALTWTGGRMDGAGTTHAEGGIVFNTSGGKTLARQLDLPVGQEAVWATGNVLLADGGVFNNSGTFRATHTSNANIDDSGATGDVHFNNIGTFIKDTGSSSDSFVHSQVVFNNTGSVVVNDGRLFFNQLNPDGLTGSGSYEAAAGGTIRFGGTATISDVSGAGKIEFTGPTVTIDGIYAVSGITEIVSGTVDFSSGNAPTFGTVNHNLGTVTGSDTLTVNGMYTVAGGTMDGSGTTIVNGGITFETASSVTAIARTVNIPVTAEAYWRDGFIDLFPGAVIDNYGTFRIQHDGAEFMRSGASGTPDKVINNFGTVVKEDHPTAGTAGLTTIQASIVYNNVGATNVVNGELYFALGTAATPRILGSGSYVIDAGARVQFAAFGSIGSVSGAGQVDFTNRPVTVANYNTTGITQFISSSVDFSGGSPVEITTYRQIGGNVIGSDNVNVNGLLHWENGTMGGTGMTTAKAGAFITGSNAKTLSRTLQIPAGQNVEWENGAISLSAGTINNNGIFEAKHQSSRNISGSGTVNNAGSFVKNDHALGSGTTTVSNTVFFNNTGTVISNAADLRFGQSNSADYMLGNGSYTANSPGQLSFGGRGNLQNINGNGNVLFFANAVTVNGVYNVMGATTFSGNSLVATFPPAATMTSIGSTLTIGAGIVDFSSGESPINVPVYTQTGGTVTGTDSIAISGLTTFNNGIVTTTANPLATFELNGGILFDTNSTKNIGRTFNLPIGQTANWANGDINFRNTGMFNNNGTFIAKHDTNELMSNTDNSATQFNNNGAFIKQNPDAGAVGASTIQQEVYFNNIGSVSINAGRLTFNQPVNDTYVLGNGGYVVNAGATLNISTNAGPSSITGAGDVIHSGGIVDYPAGATYNISGTTTISSGVVDFSGVSPTINALTQSNGVLTSTDNFDIGGLYTWSGGDLFGGSTAVTNANGGISFEGSTKDLERTLTIPIGQTANWVNGNITLKNTATLNINGTFIDKHVGNDSFGSQNINTGVKTVNNNGIYIKQNPDSGTGGNTTVANTIQFNNNGSVTLNVFNFNVVTNAIYTQDTPSSVTTLSGGTMQTGNNPITLLDGLLTGSGTVTGDVTVSGGAIAPGINVGSFNVTSDYIQESGGSMNIELGGLTPITQHDQIINGTSTIDGTLNVTLTGGFTPVVGNTFVIETHASSSGNFATLNLPAIAGTWAINYNPTDITLTVN